MLDLLNIFSSDKTLLLILLAVIIVPSSIVILTALAKGKSVSLGFLKISSPDMTKSSIYEEISLNDAFEKLSNGVNEILIWNPSWQTELATNPTEWMNLHITRYLNNKINRVVYIIIDHQSQRADRKYFYNDSFYSFLNIFLSKNKHLEEKINEKMHIYKQHEMISDLTFFISQKKDGTGFIIIFVNEEPFSQKGVPRKALYSENKEYINDFITMINTTVTHADKENPAEYLKNYGNA